MQLPQKLVTTLTFARHANTGRLLTWLGVVALGGLATVGAQPVWAQPDNCIQDQWKADGNKQNLTCTANDVRVAAAGNIRDLNGDPLDTCIAGSTFSFIADFDVVLGAQQRFDIGLYFATDGDEGGTGDGAITGMCSVNIITPLMGMPVPLGSPNFVQLDPAPDVCGDIDSANNPQIVTVQVDNVLCQDADGDMLLDLPNCTSWRQDGANEVCLSSADAFPGSPSKCNCDPDFNIPVMVEPGSIEVTKSASCEPNPDCNEDGISLPEPGGEFTFTVTVQNAAQFTTVELNRICDSDHGLIADTSGIGCPPGLLGAINDTTCMLPVTLDPDDGMMGGTDEYTCTFTADVLSMTPVMNQTDTVTVFGVDETGMTIDDSDSASVAITDVPPMAMVTKAVDQINCVNVTYDVDVKNTSMAEPLTLTALNDNQFGNITTVQGDVTATTCDLDPPVVLQPNDGMIGGPDEFSCSFNADFCGTEHTNKVTGTLNDDDELMSSVIMPTSDDVTVCVEIAQCPPPQP